MNPHKSPSCPSIENLSGWCDSQTQCRARGCAYDISKRPAAPPSPIPVAPLAPVQYPLAKEVFMQQYVLNRAHGHIGGLQGREAAREAMAAWAEIRKACE